MKKTILILIIITIAFVSNAQEKVYSTKTGKISFVCDSKAESVEADNAQTTCKLSKSGQLVFGMLVRGFKFENSTMEEHFNENFIESKKFPKADFKGTITNITSVNFDKDGSYPINVDGTLTLHGVSKSIKEKGTIIIKAGKVFLEGKFKINIPDFGIKDSNIGKTLSKEAKLNVSCKFD